MNAPTSNRAAAAATSGDQAAGLRNLLKRRTLRILPVIGDHDAQGQGACAAQIALGMARGGRSVILLDAVGAALTNLGFRPQADLISMIEGRREFVVGYGPDSDWWMAREGRLDPRVAAALQSDLLDLARHHHALAQQAPAASADADEATPSGT